MRSLVVCLICLLTVKLSCQTTFSFPETEKIENCTSYFGTKVCDNYHWLEESGEKTSNWLRNQQQYTDSFFQSIPYLKKLEQDLRHNSAYYIDHPASQKKYTFAIFSSGDWKVKRDYETNTPKLYYRYRNDLHWQLLIDPLKFRKSPDEHVIVTNYRLSPDNKYLAFSLSRNGSDWKEIRVIEMSSEKMLTDVIRFVKGNLIEWYKDGFFYEKYEKPPLGQELTAVNINRQLCYHVLGSKDTNDNSFPGSFYDNVDVLNSDHLILYATEPINKKLYYTLSILDLKDTSWGKKSPKRFAAFPAITRYRYNVLFVRNDSVCIQNNFLADKGMIVMYNTKSLNEFNTIIPPYNEVLVATFFRLGKLHCVYRTDTNYMMVKFNLNGKREKIFEFGRFMNISGLDYESEKIMLYSESSFDRPDILYRFNFETYNSAMIRKTKVNYDVSDHVIKKTEYKSIDGVNIPILLFYEKGLKITENTPVILTAYGGFGVISDPTYNYENVVWTRSGGIIAMALIRGGGEKGKKWHMDGSKTNKQKSIDDFTYAAKFLIQNKYTNPEKLAITGSSHGGLIVAAAANQNPELFKAVVPQVGLFDMLNYQNYTVGEEFSDEFGTSADSIEFSNIYKYSPYHNIPLGHYPATLVITGDHDDRVPPFNSYKYVAELQKSTDGQSPILLNSNLNSGHNGPLTKKENVKESVYFLSFLFKIVDVTPVFTY